MNKKETKINKEYNKENSKMNNYLISKEVFNFHNDYNYATLWFDSDTFNKDNQVYFAEDKFYKYIIVSYSCNEKHPTEVFSQYLVPKYYSYESLYDLTYKLCTLRFNEGKNIMHEIFPNFIDYMFGKLWILHGGINLEDKKTYNFFYGESVTRPNQKKAKVKITYERKF